jgi:hypothetical protein
MPTDPRAVLVTDQARTKRTHRVELRGTFLNTSERQGAFNGTRLLFDVDAKVISILRDRSIRAGQSVAGCRFET